MKSLIPVLALFVAVGGCDRQMGVVSPRFDLSADYDCANPLVPPAGFRILSRRDDGGLDTMPMLTNRYLEPHRAKDTVATDSAHGITVRYIVGYATPSSCVTLADSVIHRMGGHFGGYLTYP